MNLSPHALGLAAAASLFVAGAPVHALVLNFSGSGVVSGPAQTPPVFNDLRITPSDASYTFGGVAGWTLDVVFSGGLTATGGYSGLMSGQFHGPVSGDTLFFTGSQAAVALGQPIALSYTVTGGSGAWAGYTGAGSSTVTLLGNPFGLPTPVPFIEADGVLNLQPVPEPASWALWLTGLAVMAGAARRRRA